MSKRDPTEEDFESAIVVLSNMETLMKTSMDLNLSNVAYNVGLAKNVGKVKMGAPPDPLNNEHLQYLYIPEDKAALHMEAEQFRAF